MSDINFKAYTDNTSKYIENNLDGHTGGLNPEERALSFRTYLESGKVLEVGAGAGLDSAELVKLGFDVTPSDFIENFNNTLISKGFSPININLKDANPIPLSNLDGVYANAVFVHFNKDEFVSALKKIANCLKDGGVIFLSLIHGQGNEITGSAKGIEREFFYYTEEQLKEILEASGFEVIEEKYLVDGKWIHCFARKS